MIIGSGLTTLSTPPNWGIKIGQKFKGCMQDLKTLEKKDFDTKNILNSIEYIRSKVDFLSSG